MWPNSPKRNIQAIKRNTNAINVTMNNQDSHLNLVRFTAATVFLFSTCCFCSASELPHSNVSTASDQQFRLDCQPGEQRQFSYDSSTKVWGSSDQQVHLRATLRLRCMEAPTNSTLKYLAEIVSLEPNFSGHSDLVDESKTLEKRKKDQVRLKDRKMANLTAQLRNLRNFNNDWNGVDAALGPRAEPLLEEVGEVAIRMKRSVSGWFSKTWTNVKDFFTNIFSSSERSSVSREQAFKESGLDIAGQCKSSSSKGKSPVGLPFDESVFDDLGPEYYIGASLDAHGTAYEFGGGGDRGQQANGDHQEDDDDQISFFDDPRPRSSASSRAKRATSTNRAAKSSQPADFDKLIKLPFVFVQSRTGKITEVRFGSDESDLSVKNFKRHLCDLFATNLDSSKSQANEISPIGKHQTKYQVNSSPNSMDNMKQSLISSSSKLGDEQSTRQLVRVLAMVGQSNNRELPVNVNNTNYELGDEHDDNGRDSGGQDNGDPVQASQQVSVLRSINTTTSVQLNSKTMAPDIDQIQVQVKQVQQINEGRLMGTAGQLSMSLLQGSSSFSVTRTKRETTSRDNVDQIGDIAELLQVSTSFSLKLVPIARRPDGSIDDEATSRGRSLSRSRRASPATDVKATNSTRPAKRIRKSASSSKQLVRLAPSDSQELQRVLQEWRKQEARLQLSSSNLVAENNGQQESQLQRLEILRDQVRLRLNEEFVRNRMRRSLSLHQVAAVVGPSKSSSSSSSSGRAEGANGDSADSKRPPGGGPDGDFGLGLTQIILGNGITTKQKGSIYDTIEEVVELESHLADETGHEAISRLLRETIRMDKLKKHCKSAIATVEELRESSGKLVETKQPFGVEADVGIQETRRRSEKVAARMETKNQKKLDQCRQILQLMLRLSERQAADQVLELIDECNHRLLVSARNEELGYGPAGKYYRHKRQQFVELLASFNRPTDAFLDKLMGRLNYSKLKDNQEAPLSSSSRRSASGRSMPEFVYVGKDTTAAPKQHRYNKSVLKEEDDYNNNDGAGSLVMTLTTLAAKSSVSRAKRVELAERLLMTLKGTTCSLFDGPDLDILESMANFQEPLDEIVAKVVHLARKCKHSDQYVIGCVHGLSGQLQNQLTQRFLNDQLKSQNGSCTLKSEIVSTLIGAQLVNDIRWPSESNSSTVVWPNSGLNQVDETLIELVNDSKKYPQSDRRCLRQLVWHYLSRKRHLNAKEQQLVSTLSSGRSSRSSSMKPQRLFKRAVVNEHKFWDEAECKRWTMAPSLEPATSDNTTLTYNLGGNISLPLPPNDLIDEIDDNSILNALINQQQQQQQQQQARGSRSQFARRNQKLIERELAEDSNSNSAKTNSYNSTTLALRKRHKCVGSKQFGPKNAQAILKAEIVNDLIGPKDENKFLARFRLATNFLGQRIDVGRMYLWHQRRTTRAHANILGKAIWDTSHGCQDKAPNQVLYMPLFDFNLWLVKVSVGLRLNAEMGFFSNCEQDKLFTGALSPATLTRQPSPSPPSSSSGEPTDDQLELYPTISLRASGEASAKFVLARAGMSVASQYGYQGSIKVSRQPESCMSIHSAHQPMNVTFSSWFQLWDNDCHFWGSRNRAEPQAVKWRLMSSKPMAWIEDECLISSPVQRTATGASNETASAAMATRSPHIISP